MTQPARFGALALSACLAVALSAIPVQPAAAREARQGLFGSDIRMPWQTRAKPERRTKRPPKPSNAPPARPEAKPQKGRRAPTAPAAAGAAVAAEPLLPAPKGPPTLEPRAATRSMLEGWRAFAAQVPPPDDPPPISPYGPAPAPANVLALYVPTPSAIEPVPERALPRRSAAPVPIPPRNPDDDEFDSPDAGRSEIPLPPVRPGDERSATSPLPPAEAKPEPGGPDIAFDELPRDLDPDCQALEAENVAVFEPLPPIEGPGFCGSAAPVLMTGVRKAGGGVVEIKPAATVRCAMAREVAAFIRRDLAEADAGSAIARIEIAGSFSCRGRNGSPFGKMSEHGRADAIDVSGVGFANGENFGIFAKDMPEAFADKMKSAACARFMTVLGPGSDGHHETHLHLDMQPRRSKSRLCQWNDPAVAADAPPPVSGEKDAAKPGEPDDRASRVSASKAHPHRTEDAPLPKARETP